MDEKHLMPALLVLVVLGLGILGYGMFTKTGEQTFYVDSQQPEKDSISVSGEARTTATPDIAYIAFTITTNSSSAMEAQQENAEKLAAVKSALLAKGVSESDLETQYLSVGPTYEWEWDCPEDLPDNVETSYYYDCTQKSILVGYEAVHQIRLKSEDTGKTGELVDVLTKQGGNEMAVGNIALTLKDETRAELEKELLKEASADARLKALKIA